MSLGRANPLVQHRDIHRWRIGVQPRSQNVRPAVILVRVRAPAVGDRITNRDGGFCGSICHDVDARDVIPVIGRRRRRQARRTHAAATGLDVGRRPRARVANDTTWNTAEGSSDRDIAESWNGKVE